MLAVNVSTNSVTRWIASLKTDYFNDETTHEAYESYYSWVITRKINCIKNIQTHSKTKSKYLPKKKAKHMGNGLILGYMNS